MLLTVGAYYCPTPYWLKAPGPTYIANSLVHVEGTRIYSPQGRLLLLTVVSEPATLLYCLYAFFDPSAELTNSPGGQPQAQAGPKEDAWQMSLSQSISTTVALDYVLDTYPDTVRGLKVVQVMPDSPNRTILQADDLLLRLDDRPIRHVRQIARTVSTRPANSVVTATLERAGKQLTIPLKVWQHGSRRMLGAHFAPVLRDNGQPVHIRIDSEKVVGASGGLVFCLELINQLTPQDLTRGRVVAVTGTLDPDGRVGAIEGARFKLIAAQRAGAQLFVCPAPNALELKGVNTSVEVVGVSNLREALQVLQAKRQKS